ncbi:hypothetical protein M8756_03310 [Lutimaribacter sp. EGI FJ00015]|uniref:Uncharacterized protein n=1 Tax=Lutimaribacter degradans TaxID=2945989 RepID=A0ACC5ZRC0_9RHOB|nr:hypothetical protein [Lutimaribacter sp. EGI FJ00013]MCM2560728.1 hypothetical protein [Lutimaribacter sp. EGI FJ00013]MCO0612326.1 hypothetical protein [Lutimaribacter sp. EGI FJ00015]MCO0634553.1 hypothetical protein [Lutimaribacter sp. EGI FJ00014]
MRHLLFALLLWPAVAQAQSALSAQEFDALTQGKTFTYAENGEAYGAEEYLPDRRVRWSFLDGKCKEGRWWEENGQICFIYEDNPMPQCWTFFDGARGLTARFENDPAATELYAVDRSDEPLMCLGPEIGV